MTTQLVPCPSRGSREPERRLDPRGHLWLRTVTVGPRQGRELGVRRTHGVRVGQAEPDPVDVQLVVDVRVGGLEHDRVAEGVRRRGGRACLVGLPGGHEPGMP